MSDLIRREDVFKAIVGLTTYKTVDDIEILCEASVADSEGWLGGIRDVLREVEYIPSAEPEQKWIPCSEALPKVRTDVLLAFEKNMAVGFYSHGCWNVNTGNGFYTGVFTDEDKPIAWMPLPESYKGE